MDLFRTGTETETETVTMDAILESEETRAVDYECEQESNSQWISERSTGFATARVCSWFRTKNQRKNARLTNRFDATRESSSEESVRESSQKHNKQKCQTSVGERERVHSADSHTSITNKNAKQVREGDRLAHETICKESARERSRRCQLVKKGTVGTVNLCMPT